MRLGRTAPSLLVPLRGRGATAVASVLALALAVGAVPTLAASKRRPDLVLSSLSSAPGQLAPGSAFSESFVERNIGGKSAAPSKTGFYLSQSATLGRGAIQLAGAARVKRLKPHRKTKGTATLAIPAEISPGSYLLVGCANYRHRVKERSQRNDCRAAGGRVTVTAAGSAACVPTENPTLSSQSATCFDGNAADAIFVSPLGDDANPGTMAAPKRTLSAGVAAAKMQGKDVYATEGIYPERLDVANGVSVYGGYDTSWQRSPSHKTRIMGSVSAFGDTEAAVASGVTTPTTLQLLTLSPSAPTLPGRSSYGLRGVGDTGLVLDHLTVAASPGTAGAAGQNGAPGVAGGNGHDGVSWFPGEPAKGGTSAAGHSGGVGGIPGGNGGGGQEGEPGLATEPDPWGRMGGPGGPGGAGGSEHKAGGPGYAGDSGVFRGDGAGGGAENAAPGPGFWLSEYGKGGLSGSAGHGGGGGGGGGSDENLFETTQGGSGAGGGGGGSGGGGGAPGQGGGGSFGIFLVNSAGAVVRESSVTASNGGAGGQGGGGAWGGAGGLGGAGEPSPSGGEASPGGKGGLGGVGGRGGGGAAGGPSIAIFGLTPGDTPGTTVVHGAGGTGGAGGEGAGEGGGAGANGVAADYL